MADPTESDSLAKTAVADSSEAGAADEGALPAKIGRYLIDGLLGQGAMGVVYAARDPDLERRIALKVLRTAEPAATTRLLREARAMARLSHPNVVTVYEVGTAGGVDYVAMELIDGTTVAQWIDTATPDLDQVLDAFDAAGRGVAAAHAAGLVHRDFKPHNVLRSRRGRVVVTDFGLARGAIDERPPDRGALGRAPTGDEAGATADSLSSTLTATGAVLGTPAYMAPEQHDLAPVGPSADQFAFCVALWEAVAGERPFPGQTIGEVRAAIARGIDAAPSVARIPRRLRAPLRRGLAVDPSARFPAMDALLAAIRRRTARTVALAGAVAAIFVGGVVAIIGHGPAPAVLAGCGSPDAELAGFRHDPARATLARRDAGRAVLASLDRVAAEWVDVQRAVCGNTADPRRARRAGCVAAVRADLHRTLGAAALVDPADLADTNPVLHVGDPRACAARDAPARVEVDGPAAVAVAAHALASAGVIPVDEQHAPPDPGAGEPCLRLRWLLARIHGEAGTRERHLADRAAARDAAARCGDDRMTGLATIIEVFETQTSMLRDPEQERRIAEALALAGSDRWIQGLTDMRRGMVAAYRDDDIETAITAITAASDVFVTAGASAAAAEAAAELVRMLVNRDGPDDRARAEQVVRRILPVAGRRGRIPLQHQLFLLLSRSGRVAEAHRVAAEIVAVPRRAPPGARPINGRVIDGGRPVAGARVVAQENLFADPIELDPIAPPEHVAISAADGSFTLPTVPLGSIVAAEHDDRRSAPVEARPGVELALRATGSVSGTVTRGEGITGLNVVAIVAGDDRLVFTAPIAADGSYRIDRIPVGTAQVVVTYGGFRRQKAQRKDVAIGTTQATAIDFAVVQRGYRLYVIERGQIEAALTAGVVMVLGPGVSPKTFGAALAATEDLVIAPSGPVPAAGVADAVKPLYRSGDAVARVDGVGPGPVTLCGLAISGDIHDDAWITRVERHVNELEVSCTQVTIDRDDQAVVLEVPPVKRLPEE